MTIPASVFLYLFYGLLMIAGVAFVVNFLHLFHFGLLGPGAPFAAVIFLGLAALVVARAFDVLRSFDWTTSLTLPYGG